jgi:capsular polysaccharide biosynthesis protein
MPEHMLQDMDHQDNEASIFKLAILLLKHKKLIMISSAVIFSITFLLYSIHARFFVLSSYYSKCTIIPVDTNISVLMTALKNPKLTHRVIEKRNLLPALNQVWHHESVSRSEIDNSFTVKEAYRLLQKSFSFNASEKQDSLQIALLLPDPELTATILNDYLEELPVFLDQELSKVAKQDLHSLLELKKALTRMEQSNDVFQKADIVHKLTAYLVRQSGMERTNWIYFEVIDRPSSPVMQKVVLQRSYGELIPLWIFLSIAVSLFLAFLAESLDRWRTRYPEKVNTLKTLLNI